MSLGNTDIGDVEMKQYYHGENKEGPYFEGWYFKCQTLDGQVIALIPAVHISEDGEKSASIQVITKNKSWWIEYPEHSFRTRKASFLVQIDKNTFSETGLYLNIEREGISLHGKVTFGPFQFLQSDIMGPFRWLADMECSHGVISMKHALKGKIELNGRILNLDGGMGYIESDRGRSFPMSYLWTQCMWDNCSLMLSVARIPFGKLQFTGCICAVILDGKEYRLATYKGVKVHRWSSDGATLVQGKYRLEVLLLNQKALPLRAPAEGEMNRTVFESLSANVRYRFWRGRELLFDHIDLNASFEYTEND